MRVRERERESMNPDKTQKIEFKEKVFGISLAVTLVWPGQESFSVPKFVLK